jgi:hypothetical protein
MHAVDDEVFAPGTPEVQLDAVPNQPIWSEGKRRIGSILLTNDRIMFQRLMTERHNHPVVDEGASGWRVA